MTFNEFKKKWHLQAVEKPSQIIAPRKQYVWGSEFHIPVMADENDLLFTQNWCENVLTVINGKVEEFFNDYKMIKSEKDALN